MHISAFTALPQVMSLEEPGGKKMFGWDTPFLVTSGETHFETKNSRGQHFVFDLTAIPIAVLPILVWVSLLQAHVLTHKLNRSPAARLETPINNALSALHLAICFFFCLFLPCEWTGSNSSVYRNYAALVRIITAPFKLWPEELYENYVIIHAELI